MNIKRESTVRLAREVADLTGESMTSAVENALADRLARLRQDDTAERLARLREITADSASLWGASRTSKELMDELYDEDGLPA